MPLASAPYLLAMFVTSGGMASQLVAPQASQRDAPDGKPLTIKLTDGRSISLAGFKERDGQGFRFGRCGVTVGRQRIMTMGVGDTEAYTCGALVAAGIVPPSGRRQRIGLIYDVSSPNAQFRTAVVLHETASGWQVDASYAGKFDDAPPGRSIPALRRALR